MPQKYDSLSEETTLIAEKRFSVHFHLSYRTERKLPHSSFPPSVLSPYGYPACSHPFRPINILKARAATHQADIFLPTKNKCFPASAGRQYADYYGNHVPPKASADDTSFSVQSVH